VRVHLLVNLYRPDAILAAVETARWLQGQKVEVATDSDAATSVGVEGVPEREIGNADLLICFGGDGTLIRGAQLCSERGTPILGVYYGRFGFVTQASGEQIRELVTAFFEGKLGMEERMMIQAEVIRQEQTVVTIHALNETVLQRAATMHMLTFDVWVDGVQLTTYPADGVMVCTPTGSTGYNLSAGGPIVDPRIQAMILTAVAPHTLSARSLVLQPSSVVEFCVSTRGEPVLNADGKQLHLLNADTVRITRSPRTTRLVSVENKDFLKKLSHRLLWSQSVMGDEA
jgi:NAD+ kinase